MRNGFNSSGNCREARFRMLLERPDFLTKIFRDSANELLKRIAALNAL